MTSNLHEASTLINHVTWYSISPKVTRAADNRTVWGNPLYGSHSFQPRTKLNNSPVRTCMYYTASRSLLAPALEFYEGNPIYPWSTQPQSHVAFQTAKRQKSFFSLDALHPGGKLRSFSTWVHNNTRMWLPLLAAFIVKYTVRLFSLLKLMLYFRNIFILFAKRFYRIVATFFRQQVAPGYVT